MKCLFIGGYYDGQTMNVIDGIEQVVFETTTDQVAPSVRFIYTRRLLIVNGKRVFVFVLDGMRHENILPAYLKLTKGK